METQISVPCCHCGAPSERHGIHHARDHNLSQGKGAGGAKDHEHILNINFCNPCHRAIHMKEFEALLLVKCVEPESQRALTLRALHERDIDEAEPAKVTDFRKLRDLMAIFSDDGLAYFWERCQNLGADVYLGECIVADAMHERYGGYGESWTEKCKDILCTSPDTVLRRYYGWAYLKRIESPDLELARLGKSVVEALGHSSLEGQAHKEIAKIADKIALEVNAGDMTRSEAVRQIRGGREPEATPTHSCPLCFFEHEIQEA